MTGGGGTAAIPFVRGYEGLGVGEARGVTHGVNA